MIDVDKIKVGDKLRLTMRIAELPAGHEVTVTEDQTLGCNWITEELVEISELKGLESWFSIAEEIGPMVPAEPQYETIIITSPAYEYMGLMKGSRHKIHTVIDGIARFTNNGKLWELGDSYWEWDYPSDQIAVSKDKLESLGVDVEDNNGTVELNPKILTIPPDYFNDDLDEEKAKLLDILKRGVGKDALIVPGVAQSALDKQEGGGHYKGLKIQPIEYIHANGLSYFQGNVVKYVSRYKDKNGAEDIKKAIHYLELILELEYGTK